MSTNPDDWEKPRTRRDHLSAEEMLQLEQMFKAGKTPRDAARAIKCSSRTAYRHFEIFRGEAREQARRRKVRMAIALTQHTMRIPSKATPSQAGRFYKGNFDL